MASPENLLMYLPEREEQEIRDIFDRLASRGFPVQHQKPHITITFSPNMDPAVVEKAAVVLPPLIPASFSRVGTVIFGTKRKQTVAWLLETSPELTEAATQISALNPDGRGPMWIPHLTMGLRLSREIVGDYIQALAEETSPHFKSLTAELAAYWQPQVQKLRVLAQAK